jgi:hypothetical protein
VATHSIGLLRALQDDLKDDYQIIYFEHGKNFASEKIVLSPIKKSHHDWKKIFKTALDDLSGLVCPRQIVYCEGRDRPISAGEGGLDARVYNTILSEQRPDTLFVSSGGNTELDQRSDIAIKILSKAISDLDILVLKDRDMVSNAEATADDCEDYLKNNPNHHRIQKRREIEN